MISCWRPRWNKRSRTASIGDLLAYTIYFVNCFYQCYSFLDSWLVIGCNPFVICDFFIGRLKMKNWANPDFYDIFIDCKRRKCSLNGDLSRFLDIISRALCIPDIWFIVGRMFVVCVLYSFLKFRDTESMWLNMSLCENTCLFVRFAPKRNEYCQIYS